MSAVVRLVIVSLMLTFSFVRTEENINRLLTDDPIIKQAIEKAPYFKYQAELYLRRLAAEDYPPPLLHQFKTQLRHFCPNADAFPSWQSPTATLSLPKTATYQAEMALRKVNNADSNCWNASVAFSTLSNLFLVVWQDERNGLQNPDIYGQFFDPSLQPLGDNLKINSETDGSAQLTPVVAPTANGGFAVAWEDYRNGNPAIFYCILDASGNPQGNETNVDPQLQNSQFFPAICADTLGFFTIVWLQDYGDDFDIYARKFATSGQAERPAFKVNTDYKNLQWSPYVASSLSGETIIVWEDKRNGDSDIFCQRIRPDGSIQGGNFKINDQDGSTGLQWRPFVAAHSKLFVVCWEDYRQSPNAIYAQWLDASMTPLGTNVRIDDPAWAAMKEFPVAAINKDKQTVFAWQDSRHNNWDIYLSWCTPERQPRHVFPLLADLESSDQTQPRIVFMENLPIIVWMDQNPDNGKQYVFASPYQWVTTVPVDLASFKATVQENNVRLEWTTTNQMNNLEFEIQRKSQGEEFKKISFIPSASYENSYHYLDKTLLPGTYIYRLKLINAQGGSAYSQPLEVLVAASFQFSLQPNFPNPFNGATSIHFSLASPANVCLDIFNIHGGKVITLLSASLPAGDQTIAWDGRDHNGNPLSSGVYIYRIQVNNGKKTFSQSRKMLLVQ